MSAPALITTATELLRTEGNRRQEVYVARPVDTVGSTGLVVLHDMFGINPVFEDLACDYARQGFAVAVPNLFWRDEIPGPLSYEGGHPIAWERERRIDTDAAIADIGQVSVWLRRQIWCSGKVAALGFCFSGRLAALASMRARLDAAFSFYGLGLSRHLDELRRVSCPVQLHYGLNDEHVPQTEIDAVATAVAGVKQFAVYRYPNAAHSFFNKARPSYDPQASSVAAARVIGLLKTLRSVPAGATEQSPRINTDEAIE